MDNDLRLLVEVIIVGGRGVRDKEGGADEVVELSNRTWRFWRSKVEDAGDAGQAGCSSALGNAIESSAKMA